MELAEYLEYGKAEAEKGDPFHLTAAALLRQYPVSIREFCGSPDYLGDESIWPSNLDMLEALNNPQGLRIGCHYPEAVLTGGIGVGKTTAALVSLLYQLYVLQCLKSPQTLFDLSSSSEIAFVLQAPTERLAKRVAFERMRHMVLEANCFRGDNAPDKSYLRSELRFSNGIVVRPLSGSATSALGQNVLGGLLDETAFGQYVTHSERGRGFEVFDQTREQYQTISRRRKSRFLKQGRLPGILALVSSPQGHDDLLSEKLRDAQEDKSIFVSNLRLWDVKPDAYSSARFRVYVGDENNAPRVLDPTEKGTEPDLTHSVPLDFLKDFHKDVDASIRDILGIPSMSVTPFMRNRNAVLKCFSDDYKGILKEKRIDLSASSVTIENDGIFMDVHLSRWVHVDLALSKDSAGLAIGYIQSFTEIDGNLRPVIVMDALLEVIPPEAGEINFSKIRQLLVGLHQGGLPIKWVSFDGYQSADSRQLLSAQGFQTGLRSMDRDLEPYEYLRAALYEQRVLIPKHVKCQRELLSLEHDVRRGKVDHPPKGSKDLSDALAGVVHGLSTRREALAEHGVSTGSLAQSRVTSVPSLGSTVSIPSSAVDDLQTIMAGGTLPLGHRQRA